MADQQTSLAVISSGDDAVSLVKQPTSDYQLLRHSASKICRHDFPHDFVFGAATAAYQVEGAYAEGGKSLSNWDAFTLRTPGKIEDGSNGCVAIDHYHRYQEDVMLMKKLGFGAYRFSISWSRVLPGGRLSTGKNVEGIKYYNDLIDFCLSQGIEPYVTIFHFELPQCLEDEYGGFLSHQILKDYVELAELCFWEFGDRVKHWITMNEPLIFVMLGYARGSFPPAHGGASLVPMALHHDRAADLHVTGKTDPLNSNTLTEPYIVAHYLILAHALAVDVYRRNFQAVQGGKIGMTNLVTWYEPLNEADPQDWEAALRAIDISMGWFVEPMVTGKYPESMRKLVGERLPKFTKDQENLVKGSYDFLGLNYYTSRYAKNDPKPNNINPNSPFSADMRVKVSTDRDGIPMGPMAAGSSYIMIVPYGIQKILAYTKIKYHDPLIYITENGVSELNNTSLSVPEALVDDTRVRYLQDHLYYIRKAIHEDHVNVKAYIIWAILDNFEWANGYTARLGLVYVDFANGLTRYPKKSALWMMDFLNRKLIIGINKRSYADDQDQAEDDDGLQKRLK